MDVHKLDFNLYIHLYGFFFSIYLHNIYLKDLCILLKEILQIFPIYILKTRSNTRK